MATYGFKSQSKSLQGNSEDAEELTLKCTGPETAKTILNKNKVEWLTPTDLKTYCKATVTNTVCYWQIIDYDSNEQNRESRNKSMHMWSFWFPAKMPGQVNGRKVVFWTSGGVRTGYSYSKNNLDFYLTSYIKIKIDHRPKPKKANMIKLLEENKRKSWWHQVKQRFVRTQKT